MFLLEAQVVALRLKVVEYEERLACYQLGGVFFGCRRWTGVALTTHCEGGVELDAKYSRRITDPDPDCFAQPHLGPFGSCLWLTVCLAVYWCARPVSDGHRGGGASII